MGNTTKQILIINLIIFLCILIAPVYSVTKENNDLLFIISLYEHEQYEILKKQISFFENDYPTSEKINTVQFIKANVAFIEHRYPTADSIYASLLHRRIDSSMLTEIIINRATIRYDLKDYIKALDLINQADNLAINPLQKYQTEFLRGKIQVSMFNPESARENFYKALSYKQDDPEVYLELLQTYIAEDDIEGARSLLEKITEKNNLDSYSSVINIWLDYLISIDEISEVKYFSRKVNLSNYKNIESVKLRLAKADYIQGNYNEALNLVSECKLFKGYCQYLTGLIYAGKGNDEKADSIFADLSNNNLSSEDFLPDSKDDIVINSWLERIKIRYKIYPEQALTDLKKYIDKSDRNVYVLYVYGSLLFKSKRYQEAVNSLLEIKQLAATRELEHNIQIMLGDIWFNAKVPDYAIQAYNNYLNHYPDGKYRAHARYNIALLDYERKAYTESQIQLKQIIQTEVDEEIKEKSEFLIAEINFYQANYTNAIEIFKRIEPSYINQYNIDLRLAQSYYYLENYETASKFIPNLKANTTNMFQVLMLEGNIRFNLKQYTDALVIYNQADSYAKTDLENQEVNSYIALTLYRLRRFNEASKLYIQLSKEPESPQAYLIMAAKASFHANEYQQALLLFKQFVLDNPNSEFVNYALANIGSIYYNQSDYPKATETWVNLLKRYQENQSFTPDEQVILASIFTGLQWCFKQNPNQQYLDELNDMIDNIKSEYIGFEIQYLLLKVYFGNEQWSELLKMADNIREEFPQKENNEIRKYVASSLSNLNRTIEADSIYQSIFTIEPTADILTEWAELDIQAGKIDRAISKLDQALSMDTTSNRFLKLLEKLYFYSHDSLDVYWYKWKNSFDNLPDQVTYVWLEWNFDKGAWDRAESVADSLVLSPDYKIRSKAQLIVGISKYYQEDYENSIIELYKTIYLYPESEDLNLEAKHYIFKCYLELEQLNEAQNLFDEIKSNLSQEELNRYINLLKEKQTPNE